DGAVGQLDLDPGGVLFHASHTQAPSDLDRFVEGVAQYRLQVAAQQRGQPAVDRAEGGLYVEPGGGAPARGPELDPPQVEGVLVQLCAQAHACHGVVAGAEEVDDVPAGQDPLCGPLAEGDRFG